MFKLVPDPIFEAAVALSVPGLPKPLEVVFTFRHKNRTALHAWINSASTKRDAALLDEVIVGWAGVQDEAGAPVAYSFTALTDLIENYGAAHVEIYKAYLAELTKAKEKNS